MKQHKTPKTKNKKELYSLILAYMEQREGRYTTPRRIFLDLKLNTHPQKMNALQTLRKLCQEGKLSEQEGAYLFHAKHSEVIGIFERRGSKNFVVPEQGESSIGISEEHAMHALSGDRVRVRCYASRGGKVHGGEVIEILERGKAQVVGTVHLAKGYAFLETSGINVLLPKQGLKGAADGDKVLAKIEEWPKHAANPVGRVTDVLGKTGDNDAEMHSILAEFGLPYKYPKTAEKAAEQIPAELTADEIAQREDLRGITTFTIDPEDAKDFDDALSIRETDQEGVWEVGVHIADVTHYVKEGSIIDKEAQRRATSVYLVDRTIPMLPERLCNFICSLRPDEDKAAFSVIFKVDATGKVLDARIKHTIIRSVKRFTYAQAQSLIEGQEGALQKEICTLNQMAQAMRQRRLQDGAIEFERYEVKFVLDEQGHPIDIYFKEAKEANKLVEEFMLLANKTVAEWVGKVPKNKKAKVLPYRIHDRPDPEKLDKLSEFIARFGYKLQTQSGDKALSKSINHMLDEVQGQHEENLIETVTIRAMQKARYSTQNVGHYGLAFPYYTHFTSPIRRYPDMMVHRLLTKYLKGGRSGAVEKYEELCDHSSKMEQIAANAERASVKYKQVEYMKEHVGKFFDGVISGVTEWGLFVELNENKCEGLVPIRTLSDDYYEFDERNFCLRGVRRHKKYSLGDEVSVQVVNADLHRKRLDFELADD